MSIGNKYRSNWGPADLIESATVALIKNEWKVIGEVVVPADTLIGLGYGGHETQDAAPGRMYVDLRDATDKEIAGQFRIEIMSSNDMPLGGKPVKIDYDLATLRLGKTDRSTRLPLPYDGIMLSKDKKYVFKVKNTAETVQTVSREKSLVEIDLTKQLI